ncbi:MAG: UDP-N-acetylmuramate dehydrogenase, partial [Nitrospirae bacterium]
LNTINVKKIDGSERIKMTLGAGTRLSKIVAISSKLGYTGFEGLVGIPGTVGGAVFMNAGSFGTEISEYLISVDVMDRLGRVKTLRKEDIEFSYRHSSIGRDEVIISASFILFKDDVDRVKDRIRMYMDKKKATQPIGQPSSGCVFKNPEGKYAGWLLEASDCKGLCVGGAEISKIHANFIINKGGSSTDFLKLMELAKKRVYDKFSISLSPEIVIVGDE